MKASITLVKSCLFVLLTALPQSRCLQPVNCRWGSYGDWSECDGCTKTQVRTRSAEIFPQFGGSQCRGEATQTQTCVPNKSCPLELGCGSRFRCTGGKCISAHLVCNGDQDCDDGSDERQCGHGSSTTVCDIDKPPPNADITGNGYDVLTGKLRASVINTHSFGGQCRKTFSGDHMSYYRLPQNLLRYTFQVSVENDFTDELYNSAWSYMKHEEQRNKIRGGHDHKTFHTELSKDKEYHLMIIKNEVEVAQFQNSAPEHLSLSEDFWKALSSLPSTYQPAAYRSFLQTYGTHYMSEGSLGGQYQAMLELDSSAVKEMSQTDIDYHRCIKRVKRRLFWKKTTIKCEKIIDTLKRSSGYSNMRLPVKSIVIGGHVSYAAGLSYLNLEDPSVNSQMYSKWAGSVKDYPQLMNYKLQPLYELVKEVPCAGLKKLHLRRAMEEYLDEQHPCHCRPCHNNGQAVLLEGTCSCICRPGTSGSACQQGQAIGEKPGVIDGVWTCWSAWGSCSQGQKSRTRSCTNPSPSGGGRHCVGEPTERKPCEDPDLEHLQFMEPHCFEQSLTPRETCPSPPIIRNAYILNPLEVYPVGSKAEYSCPQGYHRSGDAITECMKDKSWTRAPVECKKTVCEAPTLQNDVIGAPWKQTYQIGERVSLSCPQGAQLEGVTDIGCSAALSWSPSPDAVRCAASPQTAKPGLNCKTWEKVGQDRCVCKLPYECKSSLQVCASFSSGKTLRLGVCQAGALQCLRRPFTLLQDAACDWPEQSFTSCEDCQPWEKCDGVRCECKEPKECPEDSTHLCVSLGDNGVARTMTECEAGTWRCQGKKITVINVGDCQD